MLPEFIKRNICYDNYSIAIEFVGLLKDSDPSPCDLVCYGRKNICFKRIFTYRDPYRGLRRSWGICMFRHKARTGDGGGSEDRRGLLSWREGAAVACAPRATSGGGVRGRRGLDSDHGKIRYERIRLTRVSVINYSLDAFLTYPDVVRYDEGHTEAT